MYIFGDLKSENLKRFSDLLTLADNTVPKYLSNIIPLSDALSIKNNESIY